ncbi:MAG: hypothetical protein AAF716_03800 [Cyanobacteria bacterium P01_D01_bin.1]
MSDRTKQMTIAVLGAVLLFVIGLIRPSSAQMILGQRNAADAVSARHPLATVENVVAYRGHAYGSWKGNERKGHVLLSRDSSGVWDVRCERLQDYLPIDMVRLCDVPVPVARHLYTLREDGEGEYRAAQAF